MQREIIIGKRKIGDSFPPFVIAEIGINHEGKFWKAKKMVEDAKRAGAECVKFQSHIIEDEMIKNDVIPANAKDSIWEIMKRCALTEKEEIGLKKLVERFGMIYLCTPFSRASADRLQKMGVLAYKIGSGECNNYPLVEHIANFGKPVILSTGMNNIETVRKAVAILDKKKIKYAINQCTSMYPTPYDKVNLLALKDLAKAFPKAVLGLSDHSLGNYTAFAAVALGARVLEKHFVSNKLWKGSDVPISILPAELADLIKGSKAVFEAMGDGKKILKQEQPTINFAYASVVAIKDIEKGEKLTKENIWVKRPGTGEIKAEHFPRVLGKKASRDIKKDQQLKWNEIKK